MTAEQCYRHLKNTFSKASLPDPGLEAFFLLQGLYGITRTQLLSGTAVLPEDLSALETLTARRLAGEPLQYLLGQWEFYGLPFAVGPGVLIPRPETELLVDTALCALQGIPAPPILDLCSGSGCIPIAIAHCRPDAQVWGVELSEAAFGWMQKNILLNSVHNLTAIWGDVFQLPEEISSRCWQLITSNPPYIAADAISDLQREVQFEPRMALDGGTDGLDFYRRIPAISFSLLQPGGLLLLEIGEDQGNAVSALLKEQGFTNVTVQKDPSGNDRMVSGRKP